MLAHMHYYGLGTNVDEAVAMKLVWKAANDPHRPWLASRRRQRVSPHPRALWRLASRATRSPYACVRVGFALWHCKIIPPELQHLDAVSCLGGDDEGRSVATYSSAERAQG
jgi:hypothetical protein